MSHEWRYNADLRVRECGCGARVTDEDAFPRFSDMRTELTSFWCLAAQRKDAHAVRTPLHGLCTRDTCTCPHHGEWTPDPVMQAYFDFQDTPHGMDGGA